MARLYLLISNAYGIKLYEFIFVPTSLIDRAFDGSLYTVYPLLNGLPKLNVCFPISNQLMNQSS